MINVLDNVSICRDNLGFSVIIFNSYEVCRIEMVPFTALRSSLRSGGNPPVQNTSYLVLLLTYIITDVGVPTS